MSYTNRFPPSQHTRYRSSWGPSSVTVFNRADVPRPSPEEEEYADFYHERLHSAQSRQLLPLQEDLADWINKTLSEYLRRRLLKSVARGLSPYPLPFYTRCLKCSQPISDFTVIRNCRRTLEIMSMITAMKEVTEMHWQRNGSVGTMDDSLGERRIEWIHFETRVAIFLLVDEDLLIARCDELITNE